MITLSEEIGGGGGLIEKISSEMLKDLLQVLWDYQLYLDACGEQAWMFDSRALDFVHVCTEP